VKNSSKKEKSPAGKNIRAIRKTSSLSSVPRLKNIDISRASSNEKIEGKKGIMN